jgi:hypothetical protein
MAKCEKCFSRIETVESLIEEACELETKLHYAEHVLFSTVNALKIVGMLRRIDYHTLKQNQVSIIDWYHKNLRD